MTTTKIEVRNLKVGMVLTDPSWPTHKEITDKSSNGNDGVNPFWFYITLKEEGGARCESYSTRHKYNDKMEVVLT